MKGQKTKTNIALVAALAVAWALWSEDDTDKNVRVQSRERVVEAVVRWAADGTLISIDPRLFSIRTEDGVEVARAYRNDTRFSRNALVMSGSAQSNLVTRLEGFAAWSKANWSSGAAN